MKVSLEWLNEFAETKAAVEEISARLTMAGLEVEGMETVGGDTVLELNVTPNRPDCLSMLGIAREVAAVFNVPLRLPDTHIEKGLPDSGVPIDIRSPELCARYTGRLVKGVKVGDSPDWIRARLEKCGVRSLNNIVDITNYVLLELGHPLHAFDLQKLKGKMIRVETAGPGRTIRTLDGTDRPLPEDALLIWDGAQPVAVAGVMGGEGSEVTSSTVDVFLESAWFEPTSVRRTSKRLGLKTESSYRFERGTDIVFLENALNRAALLMRDLAGGVVHEIADTYPIPYTSTPIETHYDRINSLLGTEISNEEMLRILSRIGIRTEDRGELFVAYPPPYRRDMRVSVDVVEEIARIYGYDNIPVRNPRSGLSDGRLKQRDADMAVLRESVRHAGFSEVVNYSFMNPADLDMLGISPDDRRKKHLSVRNPLRQEDSLMRTTLVPSLINNFLYNLSRGVRDLRLYEISRVFIDEGGPLPKETMMLAGLFFREKGPSVWKDEIPPFFLVKGVLNALFDELRVMGAEFGPTSEVFLHSGKGADIMVGGRKVGYIGELGPGVVEKLDLKIRKPEIVVFELDADTLRLTMERTVRYTPVPRYPSVERDLAIILDSAMTAAFVEQELKGFGSGLIERVELFDHYIGKNIPEGKKSLAFRITYRSSERTLTDAEVESVHQGLVEHILGRTGGQLRA